MSFEIVHVVTNEKLAEHFVKGVDEDQVAFLMAATNEVAGWDTVWAFQCRHIVDAMTPQQARDVAATFIGPLLDHLDDRANHLTGGNGSGDTARQEVLRYCQDCVAQGHPMYKSTDIVCATCGYGTVPV